MSRLLLGAVLLLAACSRPADPGEPTGTLTATWTGAARGSLTAPAEGRWCARDTLLEILAIRADSGVGLSLFVSDSVRPGDFPVVNGGLGLGWRPLAFGALRVASDSALRGYEANAGSVSVLRAEGGALSGTFQLRLKVSDGVDTLAMSGSFTGVPILPAEGLCGRAPR